MRQYYIAVPVSLIENMCKALSEYELTDGDWKACFDKIHDACVDIDAFCRDKLNVEALKQEPCGDAISRQAMHIELEKWITYGEYKYSNATKYLYDRIDGLPPVEQKQGWIPVSERLPEKTDFYLIQHTREYCSDEMAVAFYSVEEAHVDPNYTWEFETIADVQEVIAWMPLPEPYKVSPTGEEVE